MASQLCQNDPRQSGTRLSDFLQWSQFLVLPLPRMAELGYSDSTYPGRTVQQARAYFRCLYRRSDPTGDHRSLRKESARAGALPLRPNLSSCSRTQEKQMKRSKQLRIYTASAGSGKTHTLTGEYLRLALRTRGAFRYIQAVTFTNKATAEMKERILEELYGPAVDGSSSSLRS